jgi:hypothetical protein
MIVGAVLMISEMEAISDYIVCARIKIIKFTDSRTQYCRLPLRGDHGWNTKKEYARCVTCCQFISFI